MVYWQCPGTAATRRFQDRWSVVIRISVANFRRLSASSDATTTTYPDEQRPQRRLSRGRPDRETYSPSCSEATSSILDAMGITFSTPATKGNGEVHNVLGSHTTNVYNGSVHYHLCREYTHYLLLNLRLAHANLVRQEPQLSEPHGMLLVWCLGQLAD